MSSAMERQIKPIYDAIDSGSNKSALLTCNKLLKKSPNLVIVKALKALSLVRMQKVEEALVVCDEVLSTKPSDDGTLSAMMHVLRALGRNNDTIKMFDDAYKQQPANEDLGCQTFFANARVNNWKTAQQVAAKMFKQFGHDRYLCWNAMSSLLQARDPATPSAMRPILLQLAHRLLKTKDMRDLCHTPDRFYLWLDVLLEADLMDEAEALTKDELCKLMCEASLSCDELRRKVVQKRGLWEQEGKLAKERIQEKADRNWLEFLSVIDAAFAPVNSAESENGGKEACIAAVDGARTLFVEVAERDGTTDRSGLLAQLELERRYQTHGFAAGSAPILKLMKEYVHRIGGKPCCFEDMKPYLTLVGDERTQWISFLQDLPRSTDSMDGLQRLINIYKMERYSLTESELTADLEGGRASDYAAAYIKGLPHGSNIPETETQPADDLAILAAHAYLNVHKTTGKSEPLYSAVSLLEFGLTKSKQAFQMRLLLIRLYHVLNAPSLALEHYRALGIKQVQNDTLSHLLLSRASAWSLGATGDLTLMTEIIEASHIYLNNSQDTPDMVTRAFSSEKYSQISDFIAFHDRLEHSLQRNLLKIELVRMRMAHEEINQDFIDPELIELKFNFDRYYSDNRDFEIMPNYQPKSQPSFFQQTELFNKSPGSEWLIVFMKIYIRALQQGSDLSDVVEEKLLIGDRPKLSSDPENKKPLGERLLERTAEEKADLSPVEVGFYNYSSALADWLGPHHDFCRPPPAEVLAKANKITQQKTGHSLKGYDPVTASNDTSNGDSKREEDAPVVKDAPAITFEFFDNMHSSFKESVERGSAPDALHIASITQEALCMLTAETFRFKDSATVKMHKLGNMVQSIKDIRSTAVEVLKIMSAELVAWGDREANAEQRKAFVDATASLQQSTMIEHDFVLNIAKKVTDARKKALEGAGQGIAKVCKNHA